MFLKFFFILFLPFQCFNNYRHRSNAVLHPLSWVNHSLAMSALYHAMVNHVFMEE